MEDPVTLLVRFTGNLARLVFVLGCVKMHGPELLVHKCREQKLVLDYSFFLNFANLKLTFLFTDAGILRWGQSEYMVH